MPTPAPMAQTARALVPLKERKTHLDEGLDFVPPLQLLRTHAPRYFPRVTLNPGNNGMWVGPLLRPVIELLDDNDLLACLTAGQHDGDLVESYTRRYIMAQNIILFAFDAPFRACKLRSEVQHSFDNV